MFRVRDVLIAVSPVNQRGIPFDMPNAVDDCTRCTGLTQDCPGCSRVQCSDYPTRNLGVDYTIYEAVRDFRDAELMLVKAEVKMAQQRALAAPDKKQRPTSNDRSELVKLESHLKEALKQVQDALKETGHK